MPISDSSCNETREDQGPLTLQLFTFHSPGFCCLLLFCFMRWRHYLEKREHCHVFGGCKWPEQRKLVATLEKSVTGQYYCSCRLGCCPCSSGSFCQKGLPYIYPLSPWPFYCLLVQGWELWWLAPYPTLPEAELKWEPPPSLFKTQMFTSLLTNVFPIFL